MTILVTGAAGFIGSNFVSNWFDQSQEFVVSFDLLTYAGNIKNLDSIKDSPFHHFVQGDIRNRSLLNVILKKYQPRAVFHFAAESHVDRSIHDASHFVDTNIMGTFSLLEEVRCYFNALDIEHQKIFRFIHISTDEVYGSLGPQEPKFIEESQYKPTNPYSASKAASDHLMRAWHCTYNLPIITTHCSNNYGPYQFPEKLIPLMILHALSEKTLPLYGNGQHIRDWLFVKDQSSALRCILEKGIVGETYNIGGGNEKTNLEVVTKLCEILDELRPRASKKSYRSLITFVKDRPFHDKRYAINSHKLQKTLGWKPEESFETGLRKTVTWFLENSEWVDHITSSEYQNWINQHYS